jgi:hypothetical protein
MILVLRICFKEFNNIKQLFSKGKQEGEVNGQFQDWKRDYCFIERR